MGERDNRSGVPPTNPLATGPQPTPGTPGGTAHEPTAPDPHATGPQQVRGPVGPMTVVPDNYAGPMPPGAVPMSRYQQMAGIMGGIQDGHSSVRFDMSGYTRGIDPIREPERFREAQEQAARTREQYMGYLRDLVRTDVGLEMLQELHSSRNTTTINGPHEKYPGNFYRGENERPGFGQPGPDGTRGVGTNNIVNVDPSQQSYQRPNEAEEPWMRDRPRFGFYHELVHSYYGARGELAPGDHRGVENAEWQALRMGPYNTPGNRVNEQAIRQQMGADPRPHYNGTRY